MNRQSPLLPPDQLSLGRPRTEHGAADTCDTDYDSTADNSGFDDSGFDSSSDDDI